jgi:hypothetical protein
VGYFRRILPPVSYLDVKGCCLYSPYTFRECRGIVCLCLDDETVRRLHLPPMVGDNTSRNGTAFTVTIEARHGVSTGVSAADRVTTIRTAIAPEARPEDLARPGHVFPLRAQPGGRADPARPHRGHGRPDDPCRSASGRRAVRTDQPRRDHGTAAADRRLRRAPRNAGAEHRGSGRLPRATAGQNRLNDRMRRTLRRSN